MRTITRLGCAWLMVLLLGERSGIGATAPRPNVVIVLADDLGFSDLGCYGGEIPTPHLDALAANGLRFRQFYNTARCCPTRAALLTGLYSHQAGMGHMINDRGVPGYRGRIHPHCVTLAEVLSDAGYFTAMAGKWHVGQEFGVTPWGRGFARSLNAVAGGFYFPAAERAQLFLHGEPLARHDSRLPSDWYSTDLWTEWGIRFVDEAQQAGKPFLLYLAYNAPHFPLQAPAETIQQFRGKYRAGWDALSQQRFARQRESGLISAAWRKAERPAAVKAWEAHSAEEQDRFDHLMATYAACVYRLDQAVGNLVAALRQRNLLDQTMIIFVSDNGGNAESGPNGRTKGSDPTQADSVWFCGASWAYLQNTPLRRSKRYTHEGGIATPCIVHWPAGIRARGEWRDQPAHVIDIMATCVDLCGATVPATHAGRGVNPLEGRSLVPAFANQAIDRDDGLFWEHEGHAAVRVDQWKLVRTGAEGPWELYDLAADRTEQYDLAATQPERVRQLADRWQAWAKRVHVEPRGIQPIE